ncbi:MAG: serine/threonine-protein kinase [bacterium]|nr:serine/threonine-protein kinase [bacterium]
MATWNIVNTIDQGGFGKVHEVKSTTGQQGALKELKSLHQSNVIRFKREIDILQNFTHNHIIKIYDSNINGNPPHTGPFYVMEFMAGGSLKTKMSNMFNIQKGLFSQKWTLDTVMLPIIDAIEYAHLKGTYHRDLKPANLLFTTAQHNHIKVADWGIGKDINRTSIGLTVGGIGTPGYCSPEQWFANAAVDGRTDIYSLGVIFYEMMTGKLPQVYNNAGQSFNIPAPSSQNHASISSQLDNAILKMMAYSQINRYQTISQVKTAVTAIYKSM